MAPSTETRTTDRQLLPPRVTGPPTSVTTGWAGRPRDQRIERNGSMDVMALLAANGRGGLETILWIVAAVLVIAGIVMIVRGAVLYGAALIVIGLLVGPGGVSIFT